MLSWLRWSPMNKEGVLNLPEPTIPYHTYDTRPTIHNQIVAVEPVCFETIEPLEP